MSANYSLELDRHIQTMLAEALQIEPELVTPELAFGDLPQWDSLGHMELMMRLEQEFGVEMDTDLIAQLTSLPAIRAFLMSKQQE